MCLGGKCFHLAQGISFCTQKHLIIEKFSFPPGKYVALQRIEHGLHLFL